MNCDVRVAVHVVEILNSLLYLGAFKLKIIKLKNLN